MRGTVIHAPGDIRFEQRPDPTIEKPTDAIIRITAACVCGSDLWPYRGAEPVDSPTPIGHEYVGVVEAVGSQVATIKPGQFVVGGFSASDNTCEICRAGFQTSCIQREWINPLGAQSELLRVPLADGTLVATPDQPDDDLIPSLLTASDVLGTGWFAAVAAQAGPGKTVVVVGDGAVGLLGVLSAKQLGHRGRRNPGVNAAGHPVDPARRKHRNVGVSHGVELPGEELFFSHAQILGGPAPVRRFLPDLIDRILNRSIDPGKVFDLELPLDQVAEGCKAMDERRAIKTLLKP